ncbi:MAG: SatD family protein [Monoglobales bacterium]
MTYIVLRSNIIDWGETDNKEQLTEQIKDTLRDFNSDIEEMLISPLEFEDGIIEGVFKQGKGLYEILLVLEFRFKPLNMQFGIGICKDTRSAIPMGRAQKRASDMLEQVINCEHRNKCAQTNIMLKSDDDDFDKIINSLLFLAFDIKNGWSRRQTEILVNYFKSNENQVKAADRMGISQSSVQRSLRSAKYYLFKNTINGIDKAFGYITD